ncbi:O-acetyl-ADP-ribose deacetylase [Halobacillus salinarum]|uniref:O-acetyl-ADP-ribose deacetylase n=1 Tax=Halobacillus salinarum TaxID=2932257 RepID=A0ABY4EPI8_9BACI|nr:O-acetyl-ADP-ribose deacetylase [Halobacillus salinarum]UOQ46375.1 O-acetyl-ADP-ribose deacetylase [Halobacillus salinarum]
MEVIKADITKLDVDAIVNAANKQLKGGGGVDGAIHRAGGAAIMEECRDIGGCETGEAVITTAGELPSKKVIHTVGPVWNGGGKKEEQLLASCYSNSLKTASENDLKTVAFPNISTGIYGFPKDKAADIAIDTVGRYLEAHQDIEKVAFVCFDDENKQLYEDRLT